MTIKQCYQAMGADFEEISQRIPSEAMILFASGVTNRQMSGVHSRK